MDVSAPSMDVVVGHQKSVVSARPTGVLPQNRAVAHCLTAAKNAELAMVVTN